jgi:c(7)-type cytochrome triheme protein
MASASPIVYPAQRLPLVFSHRAHLARGARCEQCHSTAATSRSAVDDLLPEEAACRACHAIDRAQASAAACGKCHAGYRDGDPVARVWQLPPPLVFSHADHAQGACESCHAVRDVELATTAQLPSMQSCFGCHAHADGADERRCSDCHLSKLGGLMQTQFPTGELVPHDDGLGDAHGQGFSKDHKQEARQVGATCNACHDQSECVACHQGVTKPDEFHPGDYVMTHAIDARRGSPDCSACHRAESFCVGCHERTGVSTRASTRFETGVPGREFHPVGWASPSSGGPNRHAGEARRNIASCASCHREEDCTTCHTAEPGMGNVSPHGSGWKGSARCRAMDRDNRRMCLRCHTQRSELGCDWGKG